MDDGKPYAWRQERELLLEKKVRRGLLQGCNSNSVVEKGCDSVCVESGEAEPRRVIEERMRRIVVAKERVHNNVK